MSFDHLQEWQIENLEIANGVVENFENYGELPTRFDINEYEIMEDFCFSIEDEHKQNVLLRAINGKGAFRRFKDAIIDLGIEDQWYAFRTNQFKQIAIRWCEDYTIDYIESIRNQINLIIEKSRNSSFFYMHLVEEGVF